MVKAIATWAATAMLCMGLVGCDLNQVLTLTPEDRINAAFPVTDAVRNARASLTEMAPQEQRKDIDTQFNIRLRLRALGCAKTYSPAWLTSLDEIRKNVGEQSCFSETDEGISRWLSLRRVGLILAQPALKPAPTNVPAFIVADDYIQAVQFAANAGVALITTSKAVAVVDFEANKPIFRGEKGHFNSGTISPNGRLFTTGEGEGLNIRDAQSGATLVDLKTVRASDFQWLDERTLFYKRNDSGKAVLVDLPSGTELPLPMVNGSVQRVVRVPKVENQYVMFSGRAINKVEVLRNKPEPEVKLLAEKINTGVSWSSSNSGVTADGATYFSVNGKLTLVALSTLEIENISIESFYLQSAVAAPDADKLILTGQVQPSYGESARDLIFSIGNRTVASIDRTKLPSQRYLHIPSLQRHGVLSESKIAVLDELPTTGTMPLAQFISETLEVVNQRKLEAFEQQEQMQESMQQRALIASPGFSEGSSPVQGRDVQVEAVGVYQGSLGGSRVGDARGARSVEVRIRRSSRPMVLVLSSYASVRWVLVPDPGVRLAAVLLSGYEPSQVIGAGAARVVTLGRNYAYQQDSSEYKALNLETMRWAGKGIGFFQGRYEGSSFQVGGG